jgi:hypothetical protein
MAFKIPNFYQKTSPLRQQKTSPWRQHEEGHEYKFQENPTEERKIYLPNGQLRGTLWSDGTFMKSDWVLQKEAEDKDTTPANEAMTPYISEEEAIESGQTFGGDNFSPDGEGTEWFYDDRGQQLEIQDEETVNKDFEKLNDETNKYLNVGKYAPGYDAKAEAMKQRLKDLGMDPDLDVKGVYEEKKDPSKVNWSEAPPLNTQERTQWYIDNNQGLDHTTPPLIVAETEPEPIEEVMTSSAPRARNNRRTRRRDRIIARNEKAELRNKKAKLRTKGIKGDVKFGDTTLIDGEYVDQDFQDPNIS